MRIYDRNSVKQEFQHFIKLRSFDDRIKLK